VKLNDIEANVIAVLKEVQQLSGRAWSDLDPSAKPIGELDGFDSLASIEATVVIEAKLGCKVAQSSLFISDDGTRALTIRDVCERLATLLEGAGGRTR
jgi:acyl carrier protein